ncbi:PRONE domain-containing protein [Cinnamomum micranthum f. kanehirae]|uniref:PRONE domain-containing protein n=1 Tax=Cinnamomum micranthum f. kanehirae TaxID=337451 RepID=A0A443NX87_9MAGN|nr:PRONE domain-containing protein [Cinnamomum micranthum f. kanehirae]
MGKPLHIGHNILKLVSGKLHIHNLMPGSVGRSKRERPVDDQDISYSSGYMDTTPRSCPGNVIGDEPGTKEQQPPSDMELMKERFSKLLLGEDMSGGGKGVSSALALSNAITNLAASVFGEQSRLEPMSNERKARWRREMDWLLSVTDYIVEFVPSRQKSKDGIEMEIMITRQRIDLNMNIPALRKLDAMLIGYLDNFKDQKEFWYVKRDADDGDKGNTQQRQDEKWWLPKPRVSPEGLSEVSRKWLRFQKESVSQVLKLAMAINAQVLSEMEVPEDYIESLPKNGRVSLGDSIYRSITIEYFDPEQFLSSMDLSTEHKVIDLKDRIEASIVIWKRKMNIKDGKTWGLAVSIEKRELFEERAETVLILLKQRFPGISQSVLDISKIQFNRDVGQAILESYSRILESLAHTVMSRIDDVLYADSLTRNPSPSESYKSMPLSDSPTYGPAKSQNPAQEKVSSAEAPATTTLLDFMGWDLVQEMEMKRSDSINLSNKLEDEKSMKKPHNVVTHKRVSYLEKLELLGNTAYLLSLPLFSSLLPFSAARGGHGHGFDCCDSSSFLFFPWKRNPFEKSSGIFGRQRCLRIVSKAIEGKSDSSTSLSIVKSVKSAWDNSEDRIGLVGLGFAAVVAVWTSSKIIGAIDKLPLFPTMFEIIGILFSTWFVYRYLLFKPDREELVETVKSTVSNILGQ